MQEWEFWDLVKHNSNFLIFEDRLSFEDLQKITAVLDMDSDYDRTINQYQKEMQKIEQLKK